MQIRNNMSKKNDFMEKMCQAIFRGYELKQKSSKFKALDLRKIYEMDEEGYKPINNTMDRIPTAEEFMLKRLESRDKEDIEQVMIDFAKIHVIAAVKAMYNLNGQTDIPESMFFIYPLSNIR